MDEANDHNDGAAKPGLTRRTRWAYLSLGTQILATWGLAAVTFVAWRDPSHEPLQTIELLTLLVLLGLGVLQMVALVRRWGWYWVLQGGLLMVLGLCGSVAFTRSLIENDWSTRRWSVEVYGVLLGYVILLMITVLLPLANLRLAKRWQREKLAAAEESSYIPATNHVE